MVTWNPSADGSTKPIHIRQLADSVGPGMLEWGFHFDGISWDLNTIFKSINYICKKQPEI